jgi:endoglucanase
LRSFNDPLATECLALAKKAYAEERARPAAMTPGTGLFAGFGQVAELSAVMQLMTATKEPEYLARFDELVWPSLERSPALTLQIAARAIPAMGPAYAARLRPYVEKYKVDLDRMLKENPYGVPIGTRGWAGNSQVIQWATTNYYLHEAYPDLVGTDLVTRGLDYIFGTHPAHNYSFVSAVGNRSKHLAYGNNRADFTFIAGGVVPGVLILKPDYPENMDDWPFLWGENEYVIDICASYIFLANAAEKALTEQPGAAVVSERAAAGSPTP